MGDTSLIWQGSDAEKCFNLRAADLVKPPGNRRRELTFPEAEIEQQHGGLNNQ